jgi:hypothetical protein
MYDAYYWGKEMNEHQEFKMKKLVEELLAASKVRQEFIKEYVKLLKRIAKYNFRNNTGVKK